MKVVLKNVRSVGNGGDGLRVQGDVDLHAEDLDAADNGGHGVNLIGDYLETLGLPKSTDPSVLAALLQHLANVPADQRPAEVEKSGILKKMGGVAFDAAQVAANITTIAGHPQVQAIIARLI